MTSAYIILIIIFAILGFMATKFFIFGVAKDHQKRLKDANNFISWIKDKREDARLLTTTGVRRGNRFRRTKINKKKKGK